MIRRTFLILIPVLVVCVSGCRATIQMTVPETAGAKLPVDFSDPVLNGRKIFLFGEINSRIAEETIQKLLYLESISNEPIDLYLQTPGGEMNSAMAIERIVRTLRSPVNTWALSECNSGGAMLLAAGTGKRRAFEGSVIILHGLKVTGRAPAGYVEGIQSEYSEFWKKKTRLPEDWVPLPHDIKHVLSAKEAMEYGIVDEVVVK